MDIGRTARIIELEWEPDCVYVAETRDIYRVDRHHAVINVPWNDRIGRDRECDVNWIWIRFGPYVHV